MKRGTQIAYIPMHADGDIEHPDVEYGFVTSCNEVFAFCRYWRKNELGVLRTTANSEATSLDDIVEYHSVDQILINRLIKNLY